MSRQSTNNDTQLQQWLAGPRARLLLQRERALLRDVLAGLVGYRLLQVGEWGLDADLLAHAGTLCHWRLARRPCRAGDIGFDGAHLPIAGASVDALLLAHTLDLADQPHSLLRECERVLNDRGQLVVLGFNPLSWWAVTQLVRRRSRRKFVRSARFYTPGRVCDWLRLLGFEPERVVRHGVGFPFFGRAFQMPQMPNGPHWTALVAWTAQAYVIVARKRVAPRTPLALRGQPPKPATREMGLANSGARRVHSRR